MKNKRSAYIKLILLIGIIIVIPIILYINCKDTLFNKEWLLNLPALLANYPKQSVLILIGLQILQVIICILPGQPIQLAASYMFGTVNGYLISIAGAVIGAIIAFYLAKVLGTDAVRVIFGKDKVDDYRSKINSGKGLLIVLLIYLIPGLPKDLVGYVAGISEMNLLPFLLVSSIGRTPPMFGSLLIGTFLQTKNYAGIVILAVVCIAILAVCWFKRKALIDLMDNLEAKDNERINKHVKAEDK